MSNRWFAPISMWLLLVCFACQSPELEKCKADLVSCDDVRKTKEDALTRCNEKTASDLEQIARHLEEVLVQSSPVRPEVPLPPVILPKPQEGVTEPQEGVTIDRIILLGTTIGEVQKDLTRQLAAMKSEARKQHEASQEKLTELKDTTISIETKVSEADILREELASLRQKHSDELRRLQNGIRNLAESVRTFDSEKINCKKCKTGCSKFFSRELLIFHTDLLRQIDEVQQPQEQ